MIVKQFTSTDLQTYRLYYVLDDISDQSVALYRRTPAGDELFEDADILVMPDNHLVVAFKHPFMYMANNCLVAKHFDVEEIVNLNCWERVVDVYDTPIENTEHGVFVFTDSVAIAIPGVEWRCDNTMYGPKGYLNEVGQAASSLSQIITYENLLSLPGVGYLTYIHLSNDQEVRELYKNNAVFPCAGLTISEVFKVLTEWATVTQEPFNNTDQIALNAKKFLDFFKFDWSLVDNQVDMQVANYLKGSSAARQRPSGIQPNKPELIQFVKKKMASSSFAHLCLQYPTLGDVDEVLEIEQRVLNNGVARFNEFYAIPDGWSFENPGRYVEHCELYFNPTIGAYVHNQIRMFVNKQAVLTSIANR